MVEVAAVVLAAGRGTRFGARGDDSKVFAMLAGRPLLSHVVATVLASRASFVVVVTGQAADRAEAALRDNRPTSLVHNGDYASGMASSLKIGIGALPPSAEGALVLLGDMPLVASSTLDQLIARFRPEEADAVAPVHQSRQGNPVLIGRCLFPRLMALTGDQGAKRLLADPSIRVVGCPVDDPGILVDVDTPAALAALEGAPERTLNQAASRACGVAAGSSCVFCDPHAARETRSSMSAADRGGAKK